MKGWDIHTQRDINTMSNLIKLAGHSRTVGKFARLFTHV